MMKRRWIGWPALTALGLLLALTLAPPPLTPEAWAQETDVGGPVVGVDMPDVDVDVPDVAGPDRAAGPGMVGGTHGPEVLAGWDETYGVPDGLAQDLKDHKITQADYEALRAELVTKLDTLPDGINATYDLVKGDEGWAVKYVDLDQFWISNLWVMIAAFLVFIMHLGFATVETGLTRAKNTVNILFKNTVIPAIGLITFAIIGWQLMYSKAWIVEGWLNFGYGIGGGDKGTFSMNSTRYHASYTVWTDFLFQGMFAATCCTIVSGAVAERIKLASFLVFATLFVAICYPITGSWQWGGGWLSTFDLWENLDDAGVLIDGSSGFVDFAGSTLVHAVGGAGALMGVLILGPRIGKYAKDGTVQPIPGHSMPLATIGVFLLWFGWFGFNGGSELSANPEGVSWVVVTTSLAAAGGGLTVALLSWIIGGKPDLSMTLNGILAGLVGITACCHLMNWLEAIFLVGAVSGVLVYAAVLFFDKLRLDDPVGAISVHGVCGIYGTLCAGLWGAKGLYGGDATAGGEQLIIQLIGTLAVFLFAAVFAGLVFVIIKATIGLRVSAEEEIEGLDLGEHDMAAYPDFQQTYIKSYHAREI